jgi:hypothetical protein
MKWMLASLGILVLATGAVLAAQPAPTERWLHVRVEDGKNDADAERVVVNVPLTLAEKVLPAIHVDRFHGGKVKLDDGDLDGVDVRAILEAVKDAHDGEFVTIDKGTDQVRVAKEKGQLSVKVREGKEGSSKVDVRVPMDVVEALVTGEKGELNVAAAIQALARHGDQVLVTVSDEGSNVRVWIDSQNTSK